MTGRQRCVAPGRCVTVRSPATTANLGPGFDTLGLALGLYDEVTVQTSDTGELEFELTGEAAQQVPHNGDHLVVATIDHALALLGYRRSGLRLQAKNAVPHGRGLGSSAAAIVAGFMVAAALVPEPVRPGRDWVFAHAAAAESHPDNVAPAVFGGLTISWSEPAAAGSRDFRTSLVPVHPDVHVLVAVPETQVATKLARSLLPDTVPHAAAAANASRAALLIHALSRAPEFLLEGTEDYIHQRYRWPAMPGTADLIARWRQAGVAGTISGAGPSALALTNTAEQRERAARLAAEPTPHGPWRVLTLPISTQGAKIDMRR